MAELDLGKVTGEQGPQGIPGSQWYQGTSITGEATSGTVFPDSGVLNAVVNDKYWNTDTNNVYTCVLGGASSAAQWAYVGNIQGPQGDIGPIGPTGNPGTAATIQVGEVTSGDVASVENTGTSTAAVFDFVLPKGDPGPQGPKGEKGDTGDPANITGAASSIIENNLSANRALISDGNGKVAASAVTSTELGYLDGVTSGIQSQLNALNSKTIGLNVSNGTGVAAYYNSSVLILNFNAQNISCDNNSVLENIILPENVRPTADRYVTIPILSSGWVPTNQIAYLAFNQGNAKPIFRVSNDVASVSNIVLIGSYVFPDGFFMVT